MLHLKKYFFVFLFVCLTSLQGCGGIDEITDTVEKLITTIETQSEGWQKLARELSDQLPKEIQGIINNDIHVLVNGTVAIGGTEFRCNVDFIELKLKNNLKKIIKKLKNKDKIRMPDKASELCQIIPRTIDRSLDADRILSLDLFGYNLKKEKLNIQVECFDGTILDVSNHFKVPTKYNATLSIGATGMKRHEQYDKLLINSETGINLGQVPFNSSVPPQPQFSDSVVFGNATEQSVNIDPFRTITPNFKKLTKIRFSSGLAIEGIQTFHDNIPNEKIGTIGVINDFNINAGDHLKEVHAQFGLVGKVGFFITFLRLKTEKGLIFEVGDKDRKWPGFKTKTFIAKNNFEIIGFKGRKYKKPAFIGALGVLFREIDPKLDKQGCPK